MVASGFGGDMSGVYAAHGAGMSWKPGSMNLEGAMPGN